VTVVPVVLFSSFVTGVLVTGLNFYFLVYTESPKHHNRDHRDNSGNEIFI